VTRPRPIFPGRRYLITRRTRLREMWLVPSDDVNHIVGYCTAIASERTGVQLVAGVAMSNHLHDVVIDHEARIPEFTHWRHTFIAKCIKHRFGVEENLWSTAGTCYTELLDDDAVMDKIGYTLANPVAARLVRRRRDWPGFITSVRDLRGGAYTFERPDFFSSAMPDTATLTLRRPDIFPELTDDELVTRAAQDLRRRELDVRHDAERHGLKFLGPARVRAVVPGTTPKGPAPQSDIRPRFATRNAALLADAIKRIYDFWGEYDQTRADRIDSDSTTPFPAGTYAVHRFLGLPVQDFT